jgi:hypothetical protein
MLIKNIFDWNSRVEENTVYSKTSFQKTPFLMIIYPHGVSFPAYFFHFIKCKQILKWFLAISKWKTELILV